MVEGSALRFGDKAAVASLVLDAIRCWRTARDDGVPVQPCLYAKLASYGCEMLTPVIDSLLAISEWALGRPFVMGRERPPSLDERLLLDLLVAPGSTPVRLPCRSEVTAVFACAVRSTRFVMKLALAQPRQYDGPVHPDWNPRFPDAGAFI